MLRYIIHCVHELGDNCHSNFLSSEFILIWKARCKMEKKLLRNKKQVILCFLSKEFSFSCIFTGENPKSK